MRIVIALALVALLAAPAAGSLPDAAPQAAAPEVTTVAPRVPQCHDGTAPLFAGGGTNVTNGIFFPGTGVRDEGEVKGEPYQIEKGCNIDFINLDYAAITNAHRIVSFKRRRNGRPLFASKLVRGPGQVRMRTEHLRPGRYEYFCPIHNGMLGILEVVAGY